MGEFEKKVSYSQNEKEIVKIFDQEKKVKIKIPKDPLNKNDDMVAVGINGYYRYFPRGKSIEVSYQVANILEEGGYI